jgi:CHASE3 domain sensor protein
MKQSSAFTKPLVFFTFGGLLVILLFVSGLLFHQNNVYRQENRELIIENDSVISVNIELRESLEKSSSIPGKRKLTENYNRQTQLNN